MKWINGETWLSKKRRLENWHKWFAWFPVTVGYVVVDGKIRRVKVWWEHVERKGKYYEWLCDDDGWTWEYREIPDYGCEKLEVME